VERGWQTVIIDATQRLVMAACWRRCAKVVL